MAPSLFRLDIAPLTPLPLTRSPFFSYRSPIRIALGSLVEISFGQRQLRGIVFACERLPGPAPQWLKPIKRVVASGWLSDRQRQLATHISEIYFSSLGNTLKHFVFPLPKTADTTLLTPYATTTRKRPSAQRNRRITLLTPTSDEKLLTWLVQSLTQHSAKLGTTLLLVPNLLMAELLQKQLEASVDSGATVLLTSRLTPKQLLTAWQRLRSGNVSVIIGTRQALFAPLEKLRAIIMLFPEETLTYKQWDMTPRYETTKLVRFLAHQFKITLTLLTTTPGLRERLVSSRSFAHQSHTQLMLVDRRKDGKGARSKGVGKALEKLLADTKPGQKIMLIAKERGVAGVMLCRECHSIARCPECAHVLAEAEAGHLRCLTCGYTSSLFPRCQRCGHMHFIPFGFGTVRTEREIEKRYLGKRILRIDRDVLGRRPDWKKALAVLAAGAFDILITTHEIGTLLLLPPLDLIAMLDGDHRLQYHHYDSEERLVVETERLMAKLKAYGRLVVQTFSPEERIWRLLGSGDQKTLWAALQEERELLGYPPAAAMIQLSPLKGARPSVTPKMLASWRQELSQLVATDSGITVLPLLIHRAKTAVRMHTPESILIKYPVQVGLPSTLVQWIRRHSHQLTIDVDPYHFS